MKNIVTEMKYELERITSRLDEEEDQISELEYKIERNTQVEQLHKKRLKKHEDKLSELQENIECNNIQIIRISGGEEKEG